ncbi:MAG: hypothetical protein DRH17_01400 [Deltaproteobacteria bacterium]|nr:MAG: hypothetical protein DRH17_01400 [Deltaproteobacteria bacterium]
MKNQEEIPAFYSRGQSFKQWANETSILSNTTPVLEAYLDKLYNQVDVEMYAPVLSRKIDCLEFILETT